MKWQHLLRPVFPGNYDEKIGLLYLPHIYSIETVIFKAPEIIIMTSMEGKKNHSNLVRRWQNWKSIPAVKRNAIYVIDSNLVDRPTPRIVKGLERIVHLIHPEVLKP